jgi:hypothetical protein
VAVPADTKEVQTLLDESRNCWRVQLNENGWRRRQGGQVVILATVSMSYEARRRLSC